MDKENNQSAADNQGKKNTLPILLVIVASISLAAFLYFQNKSGNSGPTMMDSGSGSAADTKEMPEKSGVSGVNGSAAEEMTESSGSEMKESSGVEMMGASGSEMTGGSVSPDVIRVNGGNFYFKPNVITVKKGEKVTVSFVNDGGTHDFVLDEFNVKSKLTQTGETAEVTFTPDKAGTFEFYCSVDSHRAKGMKGTLIVQ